MRKKDINMTAEGDKHSGKKKNHGGAVRDHGVGGGVSEKASQKGRYPTSDFKGVARESGEITFQP